jgi:hypothetical protein
LKQSFGLMEFIIGRDKKTPAAAPSGDKKATEKKK